MFRYLHNVLISIDQFLNTISGGKPDETISSRLAKARRSGSMAATAICAIIDSIDRDHCLTSIEEDE